MRAAGTICTFYTSCVLVLVVCAPVPAAYGQGWDPLKGNVGGGGRPVPARLQQVPRRMVDTINDWHYAMMNDVPRNEAFRKAIREVVKGKRVVDVGAGSGLLSLFAAAEKAARVYAIEASEDLAGVAKRIAGANRRAVGGRIEYIRDYSTDVTVAGIGGERADVLVSETLGTFLLGEDALVYMADARDRLLKPGGEIIPAGGTQYVSVISSPALAQLTSIADSGGDDGVDLRPFNLFIDSGSILFSKHYGVRVGDLKPRAVSPPLPIYTVDFYNDSPRRFESGARLVVLPFRAACTCVIHALVYHWEAWTDRHKRYNISTHHADTRDNIPRDMAWGQAVQLVVLESEENDSAPSPFHATRGEELEIHIRDYGNVATLWGSVKRAGHND